MCWPLLRMVIIYITCIYIWWLICPFSGYKEWKVHVRRVIGLHLKWSKNKYIWLFWPWWECNRVKIYMLACWFFFFFGPAVGIKKCWFISLMRFISEQTSQTSQVVWYMDESAWSSKLARWLTILTREQFFFHLFFGMYVRFILVTCPLSDCSL